jgi:GNAT superfamily N-acetyltransferase
MTVTIRPFTEADYEAAAAVATAAYPDYPITADEMRYNDTHREAHVRFRRLLAEHDGQVVGVGHHDQPSFAYHPRQFWLEIGVLPAHRQRGIGGALHDALLAALPPVEPLAVHTDVREDWPDSLGFVARRGYVEEMREWESRLDLRAFDPAPYADVLARLAAEGITIISVAEARAIPGQERALHALTNELEQDVPSPVPPAEVGFEHFMEATLNNPNLLAEAYMVALDQGEPIGVSGVWRNQATPVLDTGLTAVRRAYRRRGIALALKVRALSACRALGHEAIRTYNATFNEGMLAINHRLGFVRQPAWISLVKKLREE